MNDSQKYIKNLIVNNNGLKVAQNTPKEYGSRNKQYLAGRTQSFADKRAYLSSDYCKAEVQGLKENFYDYVKTNLRLADIATPSANSSKRTDDFKQVLLVDKEINYLPIGAKIRTMGSTWLVINPSNLSTALTTSVVARCNAVYNSYDYYGNIVTEPIVVEKYSMLGNDNVSHINMVLMDGYFNITCQLNENTQKLGINRRIMLGTKPYYITGFTDFIQEFTDGVDNIAYNNEVSFDVSAETGELSIEYSENYNGPEYKLINGNLYQINPDGSIVYIKDGMAFGREKDNFRTHILTFTARIEEPTINDDMINFIANGNSYKVSAELNGLTDLIAGTQTILIPSFLINGEVKESTEDYPLTWEYSSSNINIATVDENGKVIAVSEGNAIITAKLVENPSITATLELVVTEQLTEPYIVFEGFTANQISQYERAVYTATYFENNFATEYPLSWEFSGAEKNDYIATVSEDGKSVAIECVSASEKPLIIKASYGGYSATIEVQLLGY